MTHDTVHNENQFFYSKPAKFGPIYDKSLFVLRLAGMESLNSVDNIYRSLYKMLHVSALCNVYDMSLTVHSGAYEPPEGR